VGLFFLARWTSFLDQKLGRLAYFGGILIVLGGFMKAAWKLIFHISELDIAWLSESLFVLMGPGFTFLTWAFYSARRSLYTGHAVPYSWLFPSLISIFALTLALAFQQGRTWSFILLGLTTLANSALSVLLIRQALQQRLTLAALLFGLNLILIFGMAGMARVPTQTIRLQWIEQLINTLSQGAFTYAAFLFYKARSSIMPSQFRRILLHAVGLALVISAIPRIVYAHDGSSLPLGGFLSGLVHPVLGYDHLLAMLSVGMLSVQIGKRAIWMVPASFVVVMAVGGGLGLIGLGLTPVELGIAVSLVILGGVIAAERKIPMLIAMFGVGFFAVFHGYAHGAEMPIIAEPVLYAFGFLTGTALIHIAGVVIADISRHYQHGRLLLRVGGGFIGIVGLLFIFGVV
jgi:urease accessory protein